MVETVTSKNGLTWKIYSADDYKLNPADGYLNTLSPASRETMRKVQELIADFVSESRLDRLSLSWEELRAAHTQKLRDHLQERYAPATSNKILAGLKGTLRQAYRMGLLSAEDLDQATNLAAIELSPPPPAPTFTLADVESVRRTCDDSPLGRRDAAILACLLHGLRRAEVVGLDLADFDTRREILSIRGRAKRKLVVKDDALKNLLNWLTIRGGEPGPLFWAVQKNGAMANRRLSGHIINQILTRRCELAKVRPITPHHLRHWLAGELVNAGISLSTVSSALGHRKIETTERYANWAADAEPLEIINLNNPTARSNRY